MHNEIITYFVLECEFLIFICHENEIKYDSAAPVYLDIVWIVSVLELGFSEHLYL